MANINRDYIVTYSPKNSKIQTDNIFFYTSDKNTTNIYISIVGEYEGLELMVRVLPPNATTIDDVIRIQAKKHESKLFEVLLPTNEVGKYKMEIIAKVGNKSNTSQSFTYEVKPSVLL